jgi:hypothetical protein
VRGRVVEEMDKSSTGLSGPQREEHFRAAAAGGEK